MSKGKFSFAEKTNVTSRTIELVRCEQRLLDACQGEDTSMPCFLVHSFEELCWQARENAVPIVVVTLNPQKQNNSGRKEILRGLRYLMGQMTGSFYWMAETSSIDGRRVCTMFGVRYIADTLMILSPSSTSATPTLMKEFQDSNIDTQKLRKVICEAMEKCQQLSAEREKISEWRAQRIAQDEELREVGTSGGSANSSQKKGEEGKGDDGERKIIEKQRRIREARKVRVSDEPERGVHIRLRTNLGTRSRKFRNGAQFQEVYDWAGAMQDMPLYFTLHRGQTLRTHDERVGPLDETLDLTERDEEEVTSSFPSEVSFKGSFPYSSKDLSDTIEDERKDPEEEAAEEETGEVAQKKKRKRKDKRTTASREKKKKKENDKNP
ncbi:uncharacterized protein [Porites lutea]